MKRNNTSGVIGVSYNKRDKVYHAHIRINGKLKHLGNFKVLEEAIQARINAVNKYFGEYAHSSQKR